MPFHRVSLIDLQNFGSYSLRIGDLNADGGPDLLLAQSVYPTREITCLTAIDIQGRILWQHGTPHPDNYNNYSDLPVQIYDIDGDGANEVLYIKQATYIQPMLSSGWARERAASYEGHATLLILDASTGQLKRSFPIPAPADDSLVLADLTGQGRAQDFIVKDRYWNLWGISNQGRVLWHWKGSTGHYPTVGDIDNDGHDEVFTGYALIDHDGTPLFIRPGNFEANDHADAALIHRLPDNSCQLIYGNGGLHCLNPDGSERWQAPLSEAQHVTVGRFRTDSPWQVAAINRGKKRTDDDVAMLHLFDPDGRELWRTTSPPGSWASLGTRINWNGSLYDWLIGRTGFDRPCLIYDGQGNVIEELPVPTSPGQPLQSRVHTLAFPADLWGDSRDEAILLNPKTLCIYTNARPLNEPRHYNATFYLG